MIENKIGCIILKVTMILALLLLFSACSGRNTDRSYLPQRAPWRYAAPKVDPQEADFSLSALDFVAQMDAGWNLGNTLDAAGGSGLGSENSWGQPTTTQEMITGIKNSGMNTIRIPITWHGHVDGAFTIDEQWMARVKEVVDYAIAEDLYVIINIHHDNERNVYFPDREHYDRSMAFVTRIWKQVALTFRNYDERLIFEILNEPRLSGYANEWVWSDSDPKLLESAEVIGELEQKALNVIRATRSNNRERYVMITPYVASPWAAVSSHFVIPKDSADDKLILSVHAYTPYPFAMQSPGTSTFTSAHQREIDSFMDALNSKFINAMGIPVIIGEYGATNKNNLEEREAWFAYYCGKAASYGMSTILWDNGNHRVPPTRSYNELYGYYNREEQSWYFPTIVNEIIQAYR